VCEAKTITEEPGKCFDAVDSHAVVIALPAYSKSIVTTRQE